MAVSVVACTSSSSTGLVKLSGTHKSLLVPSRCSSRGFCSPAPEQLLRRSPLARRDVNLHGKRQSCFSSRACGDFLSAKFRVSRETASDELLRKSIRVPVRKVSAERILRNSQWRAGIRCAASSSADGEFTHQDGKAAGARVSNLLESFSRWRSLPALVFGLGVAFSLRPGHALANEAISLQNKTLLSSAWAGLVAGCLHTLTGPDHLAGLAPLCIGRSRLQSAIKGALWGFGHDTGQIIFGLIFLLLKEKLHIELIQTWASRLVGAMLIAIGAIGIHEAQVPVAVLAEQAGLEPVGAGEGVARIKEDESKNATTFATGVVYGLQPDALLVILPALALPSRLTGAAFLTTFLLGTVIAMGSYTLFLASCSQALQKRIPGITKNLTIGSSIIAISLGVGLLVSEFFGFSLFW